MVLFPNGKIIFIELKATGKKTSKIQDIQIKRIRDLGFDVYVIDSKEEVLDAICTT
jgi:VRR-NUC domain.